MSDSRFPRTPRQMSAPPLPSVRGVEHLRRATGQRDPILALGLHARRRNRPHRAGRATSAHVASRSSPDRAAISTRNSNASLTKRAAFDACGGGRPVLSRESFRRRGSRAAMESWYPGGWARPASENQMSASAQGASVAGATARYRSGMARLLREEAQGMFHLEQRLREADRMAQAAARDPIALAMSQFAPTCARLMHKARLHTGAILMANETENMHSLAVQMRPALECAGQVVLMVGTSLKGREGDLWKAVEFFDMAVCGTLIRATKGTIGHDELLEMIERADSEAAASVGAAKRRWPPLGRVRTIEQAEKVSELIGGRAWYDYLSHRFCHGRVLKVGFPASVALTRHPVFG